MPAQTDIIRKLSLATAIACIFALPEGAVSRNLFNNGDLQGAFVLSVDGTFVSPPPPFTGSVLPFKASQLGRLEFDGAGLAWGEATLTFHHPDIPFGVFSRKAYSGTYDLAPNGRAIINLDEFPLEVNGEPGTIRTGSIVLECYVVRRHLQLRCVLHTLISYQQGPLPRNLPVTMSGSLQRQL